MKSSNSIVFIGAAQLGQTAKNGEAIKNQLLIERFRTLFDRLHIVDTYSWRKRPWCLLLLFWHLLFHPGAEVVISASTASAYRLIRGLYRIRLKKKVYYWVIGGILSDWMEEGKVNAKYFRYLRYILVESEKMVEGLRRCGLQNALHVPNFKPIDYLPEKNPRPDGSVRFVFLSRILPLKGCDLILECAERLNRTGYGNRFSIDFFGCIDDEYRTAFLKRIGTMDNVTYAGFLDLTRKEGYDRLASFDMMLFPTFWPSEGFPGTLIDAYIAGLPVIASDWKFNSELIQDGYTGMIIPVRDEKALYRAMQRVISREIDLSAWSVNAQKHACKYDFKEVLSECLLRRIGLLSR